MKAFLSTTSALLTAVAASAILVACDKTADDRTVGQRTDAAIASAKEKTAEIKADATSAGRDAANAVSNAAQAVGENAKDGSITTAINAKLAQDTSLSALKIDVDTQNGVVALKGEAPDAAAKDRATTLAKAVDGVKSVDNQLVVKSKS